MLENNTHNLLHQLSEISDSLWRIEKHYMDEASSCEECLDMWRTLHQDYQKHVELLKEQIKKHLEENK